ncbi:hypothetical protein Tco_0070016, partial [Tanacetum coccineum]
EDDDDKEAAEDDVKGSSYAYRGISRGDLQINPFLGRATDYPPLGYTGPMTPGYDYHYNIAPDGSS